MTEGRPEICVASVLPYASNVTCWYKIECQIRLKLNNDTTFYDESV